MRNPTYYVGVRGPTHSFPNISPPHRRLYLPRRIRSAMSGVREPYISADESPLELTTRVVLVGIVLGVLMTAANAYLCLLYTSDAADE